MVVRDTGRREEIAVVSAGDEACVLVVLVHDVLVLGGGVNEGEHAFVSAQLLHFSPVFWREICLGAARESGHLRSRVLLIYCPHRSTR